MHVPRISLCPGCSRAAQAAAAEGLFQAALALRTLIISALMALCCWGVRESSIWLTEA